MTNQEITDEKTVEFTTKCDDCIFFSATHGFDYIKNECVLHRDKIYEERGQLLKLDEKQQTVLTVCNAKRTSHWEEKNKDSKDLFQLLYDEIRIKVSHIFICESQEDLEEKVMQFYDVDHYVVPQKVIFALRYAKPQTDFITDIMNGSRDKVPFEIVVPFNKNVDYGPLVDMAVKKVKSTYYAVWTHNYNPNIVDTINRLICKQLKKIVMAKTTNNNGNIFSTLTHRLFYGNNSMPLVDKIIEAAKHQENEEAVHYV